MGSRKGMERNNKKEGKQNKIGEERKGLAKDGGRCVVKGII